MDIANIYTPSPLRASSNCNSDASIALSAANVLEPNPDTGGGTGGALNEDEPPNKSSPKAEEVLLLLLVVVVLLEPGWDSAAL